jgi:adenine-specific DNA methylase
MDKLSGSVYESFAIAFSNHLATNCMMTHYVFGWRRLAPLFSIRAYRHVTRPVEINPWLDGTGRGTFPNTVRQVQKAVDWMDSPREPLVAGGFQSVSRRSTEDEVKPEKTIIHADSRRLKFLADNTIDFVLTDPPYFDNIAYSELSDFFLPWLQLLEIIPSDLDEYLGMSNNLAAKSRDDDALQDFENSLQECFSEIARVLKLNGRVVFTYQHQTPGAWRALARAINGLSLYPIQLIPLLGDSSQGPGKNKGNIRWDAVFVFCNRAETQRGTDLSITEEVLSAAERHYSYWEDRLTGLSKPPFRDADRCNFYRACLVAAALGMFGVDAGASSTLQGKSLETLLNSQPPRE